MRCGEGEPCLERHLICNFRDDCPYGEDQQNCRKSHKNVYLFILFVYGRFVVRVLCNVCCGGGGGGGVCVCVRGGGGARE